MSGLIAQPRGPLDQHHADVIRRAGAETEPNRHKDFEPITFAFYQHKEIRDCEAMHCYSSPFSSSYLGHRVAATSLLKLVSLVIVSLAPVVRAADPQQELNDDILQLICEVAVWLPTWTNR
jgi:hypothetical protein